MKFTVVIPLYNKASFIKASIESVLSQTCDDFEIIVVDDGSTDGGAGVVEAIRDPRLCLVRQPNSGVSAARNRGIDLARGEWVAFLDADDWHHPDYLATLVKAQSKFPQADTVATEYIATPHTSGRWPPRWPVLPVNPEIELITDLAQRWMTGQSLFTSSTAVRTRRLQSMQPCFTVGESMGEDLELWFRLSEQAPLALTKSPLAAYRVDVKNSLTSGHDRLTLAPFLERMRERALSGALNESQSRSALSLVAQQEISLARDALAYGSRMDGLRWLLKGRHASGSKRWWMTAAMIFFFPGPLVKNWQYWRIRRTSHSIDANDARY